MVKGIGSSAMISGNTVTGQGPVPYIAQNGIEVGLGAAATVSENTVTNNAYSGLNSASSGGILVYGGAAFGGANTTGVLVPNNTVTGDDVGVWFYNADATLNPPMTPTHNLALDNTISDTAVTNVSGDDGVTLSNGTTYDVCGYQAGISDYGNRDNIVNNKISGNGYKSTAASGDCQGNPPAYVRPIDVLGSVSPNTNNLG